jgi:capsular exopolysaccharide synthesis family protein
MSTVYEALKKAARERAQDNGEHADSPIDPESSDLLAAAGPARSDADDDTPLLLADEQKYRPPDLLLGARLNGRAADEFQVLATQLRRLAADRHQRLFAIGSALANEGKSFVALNLAISLARSGRRVMLIDADLRTPSLHKAFDLNPLHGLLSYLCERTEFAECIYKTPIAGLSLVPGGGATTAGPELFAGERMQKFIAAARGGSSEYILIDNGPVLAVSEAQILSRFVDSMIFVVAANSTPRSAVSRAMTLIKGVEILGVVLNRFEPSHSHTSSYDYYGKYHTGARNGSA